VEWAASCSRAVPPKPVAGLASCGPVVAHGIAARRVRGGDRREAARPPRRTSSTGPAKPSISCTRSAWGRVVGMLVLKQQVGAGSHCSGFDSRAFGQPRRTSPTAAGRGSTGICRPVGVGPDRSPGQLQRTARDLGVVHIAQSMTSGDAFAVKRFRRGCPEPVLQLGELLAQAVGQLVGTDGGVPLVDRPCFGCPVCEVDVQRGED
jgi:hypothetical protein